MQIYGYHRTSTKEQHLDRGIQEIERYCNEHEMALTNIFTDQETGKNFNRPRYTVLVEDVLRPGDILIVTELDRLGRNKHDTMQQIQRIKNMGVRLMVLELPTTLMDLSVMDNAMARMMLETINNMMLELYASMAQAELEKKEKRQREGIEAKKLRGEWDDYGRPSVMKQETFDENFQSVVSGETTPTQLRKNLREAGVTYKVYKNTLVNRAIEGTEFESLKDVLEGPNAFAVSTEDATAPARVLAEFAKKAPSLEIKAGVVEGTYYDAEGMKQIASVPSREVLLSKLLGSLQSPITNLARVLNQIAEKGGAADAAADAAPAEEAPAAE